jgi:hypothetical protein
MFEIKLQLSSSQLPSVFFIHLITPASTLLGKVGRTRVSKKTVVCGQCPDNHLAADSCSLLLGGWTGDKVGTWAYVNVLCVFSGCQLWMGAATRF